MLELLQSLTKKYRAYYLTGSVFDRYALDKCDSFQNKADKLKVHLEYLQ